MCWLLAPFLNFYVRKRKIFAFMIEYCGKTNDNAQGAHAPGLTPKGLCFYDYYTEN